jgi:hypothetical protein
VSVAAGVMRNQLFPQRKADYATAATMQALGLKAEDILDPKHMPATKAAVLSGADKVEAEAGSKCEVNHAIKDPILRLFTSEEAKGPGRAGESQNHKTSSKKEPVEVTEPEQPDIVKVPQKLALPTVSFQRPSRYELLSNSLHSPRKQC